MNSEHLVLSVLAELDALPPRNAADDEQRTQWVGRLERAKQRIDELLASIGQTAAGSDAQHLLARRVEVLRDEVRSRGQQLANVTSALTTKREDVADLGRHGDQLAASISETERQVQGACRTLTWPESSADSPAAPSRRPDRAGPAEPTPSGRPVPAAEDRGLLSAEIEQILEEHPDLAQLHSELEERFASAAATVAPRGASNAEIEQLLERELAQQQQQEERVAMFALPVSRAIAEREGRAELLRWAEGENAARSCWLDFNVKAARRAEDRAEALLRKTKKQEEQPSGADEQALRAEQARWLEGEIDGRERLRAVVQAWAQRMRAEISQQEEELTGLG